MHLVLSLIALFVLAGQAVAIARFRSYWPFEHYPMYSTPVARMRYPIVRGKQLTMFSLVEVNGDGTTSELLGGADIYPEAFHPLDRMEVVVTLVRAGAMKGIQQALAATQPVDDAALVPLQRALRDLLEFARMNRPQLKALRLVTMEWSDFRNASSDFTHPDRSRVIAEVSHS